MVNGCNFAVVSQFSREEYAERLRAMSPEDQCVNRVAITNYFPYWPINKVREWLREHGLDPKMPVEEHYVRVALVTPKGVVMVGAEDSNAESPLAFFDARYDWNESPGDRARNTLWEAIGCSSVSLTKSWDDSKDIKDKNGNVMRRVISVYIICLPDTEKSFPRNDGLVWVTKADDPRVAPEDHNFLKKLLDCYYKRLSNG